MRVSCVCHAPTRLAVADLGARQPRLRLAHGIVGLVKQHTAARRAERGIGTGAWSTHTPQRSSIDVRSVLWSSRAPLGFRQSRRVYTIRNHHAASARVSRRGAEIEETQAATRLRRSHTAREPPGGALESIRSNRTRGSRTRPEPPQARLELYRRGSRGVLVGLELPEALVQEVGARSDGRLRAATAEADG